MINILYGGNFKVLDGIILSLMSISKNTIEPLNIYILTADLSNLNPEYLPIEQHHIEFLNKFLQNKNKKNKINLIKLGSNFNDWIIKSKNILSNYTPFAFLRLFANDVVLPNKIIYLDTDIMCPGDIKELFNINISNYEFGAVLDHNGQWFISSSYFNSGVMLMNLKLMKETNLLAKVKELCLSKKMAFPDQTALNKLASKVLYLPRKFNEQSKLKKDTVIQHFCKRIKWLPFFHTQNIKPWHFKEVRNKYKIHVYDDIYNEFFKLKKLDN